jgi:multidrug efflux pump subunit AcrA (membrane-fusion protein)
MRVLAGRVVAGKVDLGEEVAEGTPVAVLAPDLEGPIQLSVAEQEELSAALADVHEGNYEDGFALLREIEAQARR